MPYNQRLVEARIERESAFRQPITIRRLRIRKESITAQDFAKEDASRRFLSEPSPLDRPVRPGDAA